MIKCTCGVELFNKDAVDFIVKKAWDSRWAPFTKVYTAYRCPKCFKVLRVDLDD